MKPIKTDKAPGAIGPYSQAIVSSNLVFCSGQVGLDPSTGQMIGEQVEAQTRQALTNLSRVLEAAGSDLSRVVKVTVFLVTMDDFSAMNGVYEECFQGHRPARSTVAVAGLPRQARVEIEAIGLID